jgi:signal transduction histidine kinase
MAIAEDITDRKQTEEKLLRSEAFLAEGQHLSRVGSFSWRVVTDEIAWSEQLYRIFEFDQDVPVMLELIGTRVHPEDIPLLNDMIERARGGGEDFEYEHRLVMPDKSVKYLHLIGHSTRDKDGRLEYIGAAQDVTQRRLSEEALGKARSELAHVARVTSLGVLTASIAHEVNQPLAAIITNGETGLRWLARPQPDVERARELTKHVVADARRASEIIGRIRAMVTRRIPEPTLLSLGDIVAESMVFLRHEFQSQSVSVSLDLAPELPRVVGDRTHPPAFLTVSSPPRIPAWAWACRSPGPLLKRMTAIFERTMIPRWAEPGSVFLARECGFRGLDRAGNQYSDPS